MNKQYKKHSEVSKKYKWDLSFLLEGKTPEETLKSLIKKYQKVIDTKDSKYENSKSFLASLKYDDKLSVDFNKFSNYISNQSNLDITDAQSTALKSTFDFEMYKLSNELGSEEARFFKHAKNIEEWAALPEFKDYKFSLMKSLESKKYTLPKVIQDYELKVSKGNPDFENIFSLITDAEIDYGFATTTSGKKIKITRANKPKLAEHKDKQVRKSSSISYRDAYIKNKDSLASTLYQHKNYESSKLLARGFKSSVEGLIFNDRVSVKFLETLYKSVQDNKDIFKSFKSNYKKFYKAKFNENITKYDWARPLIEANQNVTVDEAIKDVKNAMKPFGKEYNEIISKGLKENWVDFMSINNKRSGAYSIGGTYGVDKKLILMNFTGDIRSTETLAHEFGHSMHSYYSDKVQSNPSNASYPIFLAEIASIFNELMLHDYWLETMEDDKLKFKILEQKINGFSATVLRQAEWSNYEFDLYNKIDKGEPVGTYEALSNIYKENAIKYAINAKDLSKDMKDFYPSIYVPHFYYGFYVYKYAIGQLVANIFFAKYKKEGKEALDFYVEKFLSAGGSKNPLDILKDAGVNLEDPKTYEVGFGEVENNIKEYIALGKKIFKVK